MWRLRTMLNPNGKFVFLFIPMLEALLPELEATAAQLAPVLTAITVSAAASSASEVVAAGVEGAGIAAEVLAQAPQAPLSPTDMARFTEAQNQAQKNADNRDCQQFLSQHGIDPKGFKNAINDLSLESRKVQYHSMECRHFRPAGPGECGKLGIEG